MRALVALTLCLGGLFLRQSLRPFDGPTELAQLFRGWARILSQLGGCVKNLIQDVRYGLRMLVKQPVFSLAAVVVLSLGIGGSTAMFSIVDALLLKPLMIKQADQIVGLFSRDTQKPDSYRAFSYPNYADVRANNGVFSSLAAHNMALVGIKEGDTTRRVFSDIVSANYFETLGVPMFRGRAFSVEEEQPGSGIPSLIVSYSNWKKSGADPDLLGKTREINGRIFTIVGITAKGFTGTHAMMSPELYLPLGMYESVINDFEGHGKQLATRNGHTLIVLGRLREGMTQESANASLAVLADRLAKAYPGENKDQTFMVHSLSRNSISSRPPRGNEVAFPAILMISMAGVVLLIASLNVTNMMLVRGAARRKEIAIRQALGAKRGSIVQQLLIEGMMLAFIGGAAGIALAAGGASLLMQSLGRLLPVDLVYNTAPDLRVLLATTGFCVLSAIIFSLGPARNASKSNIVTTLKSGETQEKVGIGRARFSPRNLLVVGQIALSLTLLTAAGLFIRSARTTQEVQPGFRIENSTLIEVDPSLAGYDEAHGRQVFRAVLERLRGVPGVEAASMAATVPFGMVSLGKNIERSSDAPGSDSSSKESDGLSCRFNVVSEDYFATMGIPLLQGRAFRRNEIESVNADAVVVLDQVAAERLWPGGNPVGQHIRLLGDGGAKGSRDAEVVGIVSGVQEDVFGEGLQPHVYVPFGQEYQADMTIHLKTSAQGANFMESLRREVNAVDSRLPVIELKTMRNHLEGSFDLWIVRTAARMFTVFGSVALVLAMVGLYGLRAYTVARRTREIGIRLALGARPGDAQRMILREGLVITSVGVVAGLGLSLLAGKILNSVLYKVSGVDPVVFLAATAVMGGVSLLACYLPALRASRVDPMVALRYE
jgi:predicted permease